MRYHIKLTCYRNCWELGEKKKTQRNTFAPLWLLEPLGLCSTQQLFPSLCHSPSFPRCLLHQEHLYKNVPSSLPPLHNRRKKSCKTVPLSHVVKQVLSYSREVPGYFSPGGQSRAGFECKKSEPNYRKVIEVYTSTTCFFT